MGVECVPGGLRLLCEHGGRIDGDFLSVWLDREGLHDFDIFQRSLIGNALLHRLACDCRSQHLQFDVSGVDVAAIRAHHNVFRTQPDAGGRILRLREIGSQQKGPNDLYQRGDAHDRSFGVRCIRHEPV